MIIRGDLIKLAAAGRFDVIVHGCNCMCTMGAGVALAVRRAFPAAYRADQATVRGDWSKLGTFSCAKIGALVVVNAYTQFAFGRDRRYVDYDAVRSVFRAIRSRFSGRRIAYPAIGCNLAGGDWSIVAPIIDAELAGEQHWLVRL